MVAKFLSLFLESIIFNGFATEFQQRRFMDVNIMTRDSVTLKPMFG